MHEISAERLSGIAQALARIDQAISRVEVNQGVIIHADQTNYQAIHRSLIDAQMGINQISQRQIGFESAAQKLTRVESLLEYAMGMLQRMMSDQGQALGRVEANQQNFAASSKAPQPPWVRLGSILVEYAPKVAANWAPIMAAIVAAYKWGLPYLRAFLGSP